MDKTFGWLVIGSGVAGLSFALDAAEHGSVLILTKRELSESNTRYAQGGVASVFSLEDSFEEHIRDTHVAGAGLCSDEAVEVTVREGPAAVRKLIERGVHFAKGGHAYDDYDLGREGGHSQRRILHHGDSTGAEIQNALVRAARAHPNITVIEHATAIDLITERRIQRSRPAQDRCYGAYALLNNNEIKAFKAKVTVIATGGFGKVYLYTSNPDVATGDGIAMAWRAGLDVANMEFVQFHPTCLHHRDARTFLISEALRGEGGELINSEGVAFMRDLHPMGSLAPRDKVARGIDAEMKRSGADCVYLDMRSLDADFLKSRFPLIYETCLRYGIDITTMPIPVVPACHYACGGVVTGLHGETAIAGLYVIGEAAYTGLHGANRLASNSLLEGLVFAGRAFEHAVEWLSEAENIELPEVPAWHKGTARVPDEQVIISQSWDEIRRLMWNYVGIVRSTRRLLRARRRLEVLMAEIAEYYWEFQLTSDFVELRNIALIARLIVEGALRRKESRGLHYSLDFPDSLETPQPPTHLNRRELDGDFWLRPPVS